MLTTILGLLTITLVLIILFQISRASELVNVMKDEEAAMDRSNTLNAVGFLVFLVVGMIGAFWSAWYYQDLYLPYPSSVHGAWLRTMFFWTLVATVPVFVVTHIALFWFSFKYKRDRKKIGYFFPESHKLELIWTLIPSIVLVLLVYEGLRNWYRITGPAPKDAIVIEAAAQQFQWNLRYSGKDNELGKKTVLQIKPENPLGQLFDEDPTNKDDFMATELHLPVNKPVLIRINSQDVLHSFYLPHFRVKMDAVPGIPTQFWFTPNKTTQQMRDELGNPNFNYELACAELCGSAHYNMRRVVIVEEQAAYDKWVAEQKPTYDAYKASLGSIEFEDDGTEIVDADAKTKITDPVEANIQLQLEEGKEVEAAASEATSINKP